MCLSVLQLPTIIWKVIWEVAYYTENLKKKEIFNNDKKTLSKHF